jgi:DNA replication and repair protein RecF
MRLRSLRIENFRCFAAAELELGAGPNLLLGPNGAGKTSLLEAAFVLSYGRSFRRGGREALLRQGADGFRIVARIEAAEGQSRRLGLERDRAGWRARIDGEPVARLSDLFAACAVCCFEPGSHELVGGPAEGRRALVDWGLFHVEPGYIMQWRRYQRALRQRNAVLRAARPEAELLPWDEELTATALPLSHSRREYLDALRPHFGAALLSLLPEAGRCELLFRAGHVGSDREAFLAELREARGEDRQRGSTRRGPHRADWTPRFERIAEVTHLSRGQEKLVALALVLGQAALHRARVGSWPIVLLDDLASELDPEHQTWTVAHLTHQGIQVLATGAELTPSLAAWAATARVFHVEQGQVRAA